MANFTSLWLSSVIVNAIGIDSVYMLFVAICSYFIHYILHNLRLYSKILY
ncbi:hypothetical protein QI253_10290 [Staphylococcus saprophyticus]|nr:hypothetical protein [Staphylococcus saprophyticus]